MVFVPTADFFRVMRVNQASLDLQAKFHVSPTDNGLERFITATRRQNFLIPPRRHRAFPFAEFERDAHLCQEQSGQEQPRQEEHPRGQRFRQRRVRRRHGGGGGGTGGGNGGGGNGGGGTGGGGGGGGGGTAGGGGHGGGGGNGGR